jgi:hypothetical protein
VNCLYSRLARAEQNVKRFIFLFGIGALTLAGSQVALSLGIHPEHLASLDFMVRGSAALILGTAVAATGMLGLAEGYQKAALQVGQLLEAKEVTQELEASIRDNAELQSHNRGFWAAYRNSGLAVCLFLAGLLLVSMALSKASFFFYLAGLSLGLAILGLAALFWGVQALRAVRRTQRHVETSVQTLATLPDRAAEAPQAPVQTPKVRWAVRRPSYGRYLDQRRPRH